MTVSDVRIIVQQALDSKKNLDDATASMLQEEIENFLKLFKENIGKNIDTARRSLVVPESVEEAVNSLRQAYGI